MKIKKLLVLYFFCVLATPLYADQEEDYQSCMKFVPKSDKAGDAPPEHKAIEQMTCHCLAEQLNITNQNSNVDGRTVAKTCLFNAFLHHATDNLDKNTTGADLMAACQGMLGFDNEKVADEDLKMLATFCQCAQPKLLDLFKQSDSMTDKQYNDDMYSLVTQCSVNLDIKK